MKIISHSKNHTPEFSTLNFYPDQFVTEAEKQKDSWIKDTVDYFYNLALAQYQEKKRRIESNYQLVKGELKAEHFLREPEVKELVDSFLDNEDEKLPEYVQHYSILGPPVNLLVGEFSQRPDNYFVKSFDNDSQSEELLAKTEILNQYIASIVMENILRNNPDLSDEEFQAMTTEELQKQMTTFMTVGEKYGSHLLEYLKMRFRITELKEEALRDLIISAEQFYHIEEDNSALGFNVQVVNPKNVGFLVSSGKSVTSNPFDHGDGAYAAWIIDAPEISELIHQHKLSPEIINHLKRTSEQAYQVNARKSPLAGGNIKPGITGIEYDTYDPGMLEYQKNLEATVGVGIDDVTAVSGPFYNNVGVGMKFLRVRGYFKGKKKIGTLTYIDADEQIISVTVDENYKSGMHPREISLEWEWVNQWYKFVKIGRDVYQLEPFEMLDYCPIIGTFFEPKNLDRPRSLVDLLKPYQALFNICLNQIWKLLYKEKGVVFLTSFRHVPTDKDADDQDALGMWELQAQERGIIFIDDSTENTKVPTSFNQHRAIDLSRSAEIQTRYDLAVALRSEAWKLVGINEQRLGISRATSTATGIQNDLTQSYAQTEPWFLLAEHNLNKLYQALLDAALYIESKKPISTLNFITSQGERVWARMMGDQLRNLDLGIFVTNRSEDNRALQEMKQYVQPLIQNGALYEASEITLSKSIKHIRSLLKNFKEESIKLQEREFEQRQAELQQEAEQFRIQQELAELQDNKNKAFEAYENEKDRISKERIALIQSSEGPVDTSQYDLQSSKLAQDYELKLLEYRNKQMELLSRIRKEEAELELKRQEQRLKQEDQRIQREEMRNDETIERLRIKNTKEKNKKK